MTQTRNPQADTYDLSELLTSIQISIRTLIDQGNDPHPRLVSWAIAALTRTGTQPNIINAQLENRLPAAQWWAIRAILPTTALLSLERQLKATLKRDENKPKNYQIAENQQHISHRD